MHLIAMPRCVSMPAFEVVTTRACAKARVERISVSTSLNSHDRVLNFLEGELHRDRKESSSLEQQGAEEEVCRWVATVAGHESRLRAYIRRTTWNPDEIEDLLAETIAAAWCDRNTDSSGMPDDAALILQARRACSRWKAAHRREVELPAPHLLQTQDGEPDNPLADPTLDLGVVQLWLLALPRQQRAAVVFRQFRGGSFEHVARCLECSVSAAKAHHKRGMAALRRHAESWYRTRSAM